MHKACIYSKLMVKIKTMSFSSSQMYTIILAGPFCQNDW